MEILRKNKYKSLFWQIELLALIRSRFDEVYQHWLLLVNIKKDPPRIISPE